MPFEDLSNIWRLLIISRDLSISDNRIELQCSMGPMKGSISYSIHGPIKVSTSERAFVEFRGSSN